jgi:hypothetical protein
VGALLRHGCHSIRVDLIFILQGIVQLELATYICIRIPSTGCGLILLVIASAVRDGLRGALAAKAADSAESDNRATTTGDKAGSGDGSPTGRNNSATGGAGTDNATVCSRQGRLYG